MSAFPGETIDTYKLLPIYFLCDTSESMSWVEDGASKPIDGLNEALQQTLDEVLKNGALADDIRLAVIEFNSSARVVLPLTRVETDTSLSELSGKGVTYLQGALELLEKTLEEDYHRLAKERTPAYRPTVFVLTDGHPTSADSGDPLSDHSKWEAVIDRLQEKPWAPRMYAFGLGGNAPDDTLKRMTRDRHLPVEVTNNRAHSTSGAAVDAIRNLFPRLFRTITAAGAAAADGASELDVSKAIDGGLSPEDRGLDDIWGQYGL